MLRGVVICPDQELREDLKDALAETHLVGVVRALDHYPSPLDLGRFLRAAAPEVDHPLTVAVLHPIAVVAEDMNHTRVPVRTVSGGAEYCPLIGVDKEKERRTTNRRSFCFQG